MPGMTLRFHSTTAHVLFAPLILFMLLTGISYLGQAQTLAQFPDLASMPDSTTELQRRIDEGAGNLLLGQSKALRITRTLEIDLARHGAVTVQAAGGVTLIMDGPGPALRFIGSHEGTGSPKSFKPETWHQRMPIVSGIEIV
ncbi:MAG: hypothetical protein ACI91J_001266, partial [Yoonia sp.]